MAQSSFTIGRVTADLELRISTHNNPYVRFSIAEKTGFGEYVNTQFPQVWARGEDAQRLINGKVSKGSLIWVSGPLVLEEFKRRDGTTDKGLKIELKDWGYISNVKPRNDTTKMTISTEETEPTSPSNDSVEEIDGDREILPD